MLTFFFLVISGSHNISIVKKILSLNLSAQQQTCRIYSVFHPALDTGRRNVRRQCAWPRGAYVQKPGWTRGLSAVWPPGQRQTWGLWWQSRRSSRRHRRHQLRHDSTSLLDLHSFWFFCLFFFILKYVINTPHMPTGYWISKFFVCFGCCVLYFTFVLCYSYIIGCILRKHVQPRISSEWLYSSLKIPSWGDFVHGLSNRNSHFHSEKSHYRVYEMLWTFLKLAVFF